MIIIQSFFDQNKIENLKKLNNVNNNIQYNSSLNNNDEHLNLITGNNRTDEPTNLEKQINKNCSILNDKSIKNQLKMIQIQIIVII